MPEQDLHTEYLRLKAALYDPNTGLLSVPAVVDQVRALFDDVRWVGVAHAQIDGMARLEAIYGWQVYDRLLRAMSSVLYESRGDLLTPGSILAQNGIYGGAFVVFLPLPGDTHPPGEILETAASGLARRLAARFSGEDFRSISPPLSFQIGYSAFTDQPFHRMERLVYRAIEDARGVALRGDFRSRGREQAELKRIVHDGDIDVVFQPIVNLRTAMTVGYEAFCRGPRNSVFEKPLAMFEGAADAGIERDLDLLCQRKALEKARRLSRGEKLFLNALPGSLLDPGFRDHLLVDFPDDLLVGREDVVLEIADRRTIGDYEMFGHEIGELRAMGFRLAVDNVGTGSQSLQTITEVHPDFIKVDGTLIRNIHKNFVKQEMLRSLCQVARSIEAVVIAGGIEMDEELTAVRDCGSDYGQGYLFALPHHELPTARREV